MSLTEHIDAVNKRESPLFSSYDTEEENFAVVCH